MRRIKKTAGILLLLLICMGMFGCSSESDGDTAEKEVEALKEENELPEDGVISEAQMETIAGKDGEYRFTGETPEGVVYTWIYNGKMIKNPQEQKLKVSLVTDNVDQVKKAANKASVGMGIKLESMYMAAPATLELTLTEKWDADTAVCCKYQKEKVYKLDDVEVTESKEGKDTVTKLSFQVMETGDVYYLVGGNSKPSGDDKEKQKDTEKTESTENKKEKENSENGDTSGETSDPGQNQDSGEENSQDAGQESYGEDYVQEDNGNQESGEDTSSHTCTISIECSTILNNWNDLNQSKAEFVPSDGWILYPSEVEFTPGETVFDVLKRVCADTGIHMSSRYTPMYGSYYIEGINQLYEFDCGQNSGWMYRVNGWYPNYGCSSYELSDGDTIEWRYTCDLGVDVGGGVY